MLQQYNTGVRGNIDKQAIVLQYFIYNCTITIILFRLCYCFMVQVHCYNTVKYKSTDTATIQQLYNTDNVKSESKIRE